VSSLLPRERGQAAFRQGINGKTTVPGEGVLLGAKKKAFAAAHGESVKPQDTFDEGVGFGRKAIGGTYLRDQTNLLRAMRVDGLTE
jgi:hypothetical protein